MEDSISQKLCAKCNQVKSIDCFPVIYKDGRRASWCKECRDAFHEEGGRRLGKGNKKDHPLAEPKVIELPLVKTCSQCFGMKPLEDFKPKKNGLYGRDSQCKECQAKKARARDERRNPTDLIVDGMKRCRGCGEVKPISEFHPGSQYRSGYSPACKECALVSQKNAATMKRLAREAEIAKFVEIGLKECSRCHIVKPLAAFHKDKLTADGYRTYCRQCRNTVESVSSKKHNKEAATDRWFRRAYGITLDQYNAMYEAQEGKCASCDLEEEFLDRHNKSNRKLCVDHNHQTKQVRDLLCAGCNASFGYIKEDPLRIIGLLQYALKWHPLNEGMEQALQLIEELRTLLTTDVHQEGEQPA
jgi:Recombination endonuclease VII